VVELPTSAKLGLLLTPRSQFALSTGTSLAWAGYRDRFAASLEVFVAAVVAHSLIFSSRAPTSQVRWDSGMPYYRTSLKHHLDKIGICRCSHSIHYQVSPLELVSATIRYLAAMMGCHSANRQVTAFQLRQAGSMDL
jgi:hypothetical protein